MFCTTNPAGHVRRVEKDGVYSIQLSGCTAAARGFPERHSRGQCPRYPQTSQAKPTRQMKGPWGAEKGKDQERGGCRSAFYWAIGAQRSLVAQHWGFVAGATNPQPQPTQHKGRLKLLGYLADLRPKLSSTPARQLRPTCHFLISSRILPASQFCSEVRCALISRSSKCGTTTIQNHHSSWQRPSSVVWRRRRSAVKSRVWFLRSGRARARDRDRDRARIRITGPVNPGALRSRIT